MTNASQVACVQWEHTVEGTWPIIWGSGKTSLEEVASKLKGARQRGGSARAKLARMPNAPGPGRNSEWRVSSDRR